MARTLLAVALFALVGCESYSYLDPVGPGKAHTVGNPCPIAYRVLDVRVPNSSARIYVNAFDVGWSGGPAALFMVVSDRPALISNLIHSVAPEQGHTHEVSFPDGKRIQLTAPNGQSVLGELVTVSDGAGGTKAVMLRFPLPDEKWESFSATFPTIVVDRQRITIGNVTFKPGTGTLYGVNC